MNSFGTNSQGNINTVVDDQWHSMAASHFVQFSSSRNENTGVAGLVTVLDDGDAYRGR
jgi:hypothetical protein